MQHLPAVTKEVTQSVLLAKRNYYRKCLGIARNAKRRETEILLVRYHRDLTRAGFRAAINEAARQNDVDLFRKLGVTLMDKVAPPPQFVPFVGDHFSIETALIKFWLPQGPNTVGLCQLSDQIIAYVVAVAIRRGLDDLQPDTVRKSWERLGLKRARGTALTMRSHRTHNPLNALTLQAQPPDIIDVTIARWQQKGCETRP